MVAVYVRVSTLSQKDNYSYQQQEEDGVLFAKKLGVPYQVYKESQSGKTADREQMNS